jgi:predicted dehydrogenase
MADIGLGVVGLGFMGKRYAHFIHRIEGVRLVGVCDIDAQRARETGDTLSVPVYPDVAALVDSGAAQGVIVCTPEDRHVEPTLTALQAGVAVLVEKPIAHSLDAAQRMRLAAVQAGAPLLVGHLLRFEPRWVAAWQRLASGRIGEVASISTRRLGNIRDQEVLQGRTTIPLYYGVHELDAMRWFARAEPVTLYAQRRSGVLRTHGFPLDDVYFAVVTFANGVLGAAEIGWHIPPPALPARTAGMTIVGTQGVLRIEQGESGLECWTSEGMDRALDTTFWLDAYGIPGGALGLEIRHFADVIRGRADPAISMDDAIEALRLSLAMEASAATGHPIDLTTFGEIVDD